MVVDAARSQILDRRNTEIEDLHRSVAKDHHVRRLDVAMDDAVGVGGADAAGDLYGDGKASSNGSRPRFNRAATVSPS